ncbi:MULTISPECIES: DNA methyltransferase [Methylosinus]|uniref:Methyltransferase n=1 Tax=Methylosinus trichosporium (strain ATCC 35070 / NCIMB 11131 / UNIQEM 75 / OB3b) TaxID=595536 RepID=A0A2D2CVC5_METT3|nr:MULTISPECIES: DNA methyltransferase [Methylosinus]ATQ66718.1 DNA modification methylase [Methylosinus trichosporium OB3b]
MLFAFARRTISNSSDHASDSAFLEQDLLAFDAFGAPTRRVEEEGVVYLVNEFWTSAQRQAHSIHEISYRACFKPQLPEFFISRLTAPGDAVFDPFMGRGTTPVQAALQGRRPVGSDINPLSVLLTRPRLSPPSLPEIERRLSEIAREEGEIEREDLLVFYHPETLRRLCALRRRLLERASGSAPDPVDDWIRMVAINRLTGHSPGFFSVYSLPPNQAVSVEAQAKINARRGQMPPPRDVAALILRKSRALLADGAPPPHPPALLATSEAWRAPFLGEGEVRLIVTSPPFLDVVHYASDNWLRNWFAGVEASEVRISKHRSEAEWERMVRACLEEFARIVAPGGHVAFEVGEVRGGKVLLERLVWRAAEGLPFERLFVLVNSQSFTKTSNCWGVGNNAKGTNSNRVVILRRV